MFQNVLSNLSKASLKIVFFKFKLTKNLVLHTESNTPSQILCSLYTLRFRTKVYGTWDGTEVELEKDYDRIEMGLEPKTLN